MNRCVVIGGAEIKNYERINRNLRDDDFAVFCDSGLRHRPFLHVVPRLIVGDFDSHPRPVTDVETIVLPREKDDTDTVYAVKEALRRGYESFLLIGMTGARMDHTLGNLSLLLYLDSLRKPALLLDDYSEMEVVSREEAGITEEFPYFSLLNISGTAKGIRITGAKFPLEDGEITCEYQYGISNEVLPGHTARVSVREGRLLLMKILVP